MPAQWLKLWLSSWALWQVRVASLPDWLGMLLHYWRAGKHVVCLVCWVPLGGSSRLVVEAPLLPKHVASCAEHVFSSDRRLIGQLGSQLWPQLATQYTQHCLLPMQPGVDHSPGSKAQFQQAAAASLALEGEAARLG